MADQAPALSVLRRLRAAGHTAYLAGGCVRDRLLGREPKDYDVASSASAEQVMALFPRAEAVGASFGVVLVVEGGQAVEVAQFRDEGEYQDGRRPGRVSPSTPERDAHRRDFTINGLFEDPESGEVLDFVGASADLEAGLLRAIGDPVRRFEEDKLRLLRLARFSAELGFSIEPRTFAAARAAAPGAAQVAWERSGQELTRLLCAPQRRKGVEALEALGLLEVLLPELKPMQGCAQPPQFHPEGDVWRHTLLALEALPAAPAPALAWATLLHDVGKPACFSQAEGDRIRFHQHEVVGAEMAEGLCKRLRLSGALSAAVVALVRDHLKLGHAKEMRPATLKRLMRQEHFEDLLALNRADCLASHGDLSMHDFARGRLEEFRASQAGAAALKPPPLLTGKDLIAMGLQPGPRFKELLAALEDEQLEGRVQDLAQAKAFLQAQLDRAAG